MLIFPFDITHVFHYPLCLPPYITSPCISFWPKFKYIKNSMAGFIKFTDFYLRVIRGHSRDMKECGRFSGCELGQQVYFMT